MHKISFTTMRRIGLFLLTLVCWIYRISTESTFSVQTTCNSPLHDWRREIQINCTTCGFNGTDFFNFEVEWHLQKNLSITSPAKITPGKNLQGNNTKYKREFIPLSSAGDCQVIRLIDKNPTSLSLGIYTCYVTLNKNMTKHSSVDLSSGKEKASSNYVLIRIDDVPGVEITKNCRKYGYDVLLDESLAKTVPLCENESVYFPVCPSIQINNKSIAVCKPWISKEGCYSLAKDSIVNSEKMDCRDINIAIWNKSLPLIGNTTSGFCYLLDGDVKDSNPKVSDSYCSEADVENSQKDNRVLLTLFSILDTHPKSTKETNLECVATYMDIASSEVYEIHCDERCDAYCIQHDGSNVSYHGYLDWEDAWNKCHGLNKSLPSEKFASSNTTQFNYTSTVCLNLFKSSFVLFQTVIKRATEENGTIIINASTSYSEKLPYVCGSKIESNSRDCNMTTGDFHGPSTPGTSTETLEYTEMQAKPADNLWLSIIVVSAIVGLLLVVMVIACLITRVFRRKEKQGYKSSTTEEILTTNLYSEPIPGPGESKMKKEDRITAEDEYSIADTKDDKYSQPSNRENKQAGTVYSFALNSDVEYSEAVTTTDSEYADTDLGEYDVLRGKRQKRRDSASSHRDIYDRTNNVVTGIYDVTSNTQNENEYSMTDNDLKQ